jgi:dipeptidyl aminopeptidase/acylaminoacyl peptidase
VNVVDRLDAWRASALILHGTSDAAVSVSQAQNLEAAARIAADVESHYLRRGRAQPRRRAGCP